MPRQTPRFDAVETVQVPVKLKFKLKSGETVFFKAFKVVEKKKSVRVRKKKK
jgi:hypothetical protein